MSVKIGEIGKLIYVGTGFDMSANTELGIKFVSPDETIEFTRLSADGVTAPAVPSPSLPTIGILAANEYLLYSTQALDFAVAGDWCVNAEYTEGATKFYIGDNGTLTVSDVC
jgi:hypothetical protein